MNHDLTLCRKAFKTIKSYDMLKRGDNVVLGLSGGADSVALLDFLCSLRQEWGLVVHACHINHGIRGQEADRDQAFCEELCQKYTVKLYCFTEDIPALAAACGRSQEEVARECRYRHFEALSKEFGAKVATAHTLSDSVETVILNLARGSALGGLCGIPPVRGAVVRPLIAVTREEVEDYCARRGLSYVTDSTNETDDYTRNFIRHHLVPGLLRVNPGAQRAVGSMSEVLREQRDYLEGQAALALQRAERGEGYDVASLSSEHIALQRLAVSALLRGQGVQVDRALVERVLAAFGVERAVLQLRRGLYLCLERGLLFFREGRPAKEEESFCQPFEAEKVIVFQGKTYRFLCYDYEQFKNIENNDKSLLKNCIDYDRIKVNAVLRTRRAGDRFSHPGRGWTKTLKKLFNEYHVPPPERGRRLVLADEEGVRWGEGCGVNRRGAVTGLTGRVLQVVITPCEGAGTIEKKGGECDEGRYFKGTDHRAGAEK